MCVAAPELLRPRKFIMLASFTTLSRQCVRQRREE
jgi:hypothetical protein